MARLLAVKDAIPMLPVRMISSPRILIGLRIERRMRSASMAICCGSVSETSSTAN
jgi:hypothetical protein